MVNWNRNGLTVVCVMGVDFALFGEAGNGKFRSYQYFPYDWKKGDPEALFEAARVAGYSGSIVMAGGLPGFRMTWERFPDMTEDELAETMAWEEDRIFSSSQDMVMDYQILSHSAEGYTVLAAAVPEGILRPFADAARKAGSRIAWVVPLPLLFQEKEPVQIYLAGKSEAFAYGWDGSAWTRKRRIEKGKALEQAARFREDGGEARVLWLPLSDCTEENFHCWTALTPDIETPALLDVCLSLAGRLPEGKSSLNLALPEDRPVPFLDRKVRMLRCLQGVTAALAIGAVALGVSFAGAWSDRAEELQRAGTLVSVKASMQKARKERTRAAAMLEERKSFVKKDFQWEQKLILLADGMPAGISLQSVERNGNAVTLKGTADSSLSISQLQKQIARDWKQECRIDSDKKDGTLPMHRFVLRSMGDK